MCICILFQKIKSFYYKRKNRYLLKAHRADFGRNLLVFNKIYLKGSGKIIIGDNLKFTSGDGINAISRNIRGCLYTSDSNAKIVIGNNVGISSACIWANESVTIGNNVKIGACSVIIDNDAHPIDYIQRRDDYFKQVGLEEYKKTISTKPITIEDDVWIGANCQILKGVRIGARSIIAAGSVVTNSIPADCVAGGNPCKVIKYLL